MAKQEHPLEGLQRFLPPNTFEGVIPYLQQYPVHLTLTRHRETRLGDYRAPTRQEPYHRISVNATLNCYSFLITLLHEIAHLTTHIHHTRNVSPHGKEWKLEFQKVLIPFLGKNIFPQPVEQALQAYLRNPAASTCTDARLYKALAKFDVRDEGLLHADEIAIGAIFELSGRRFEKLENLRTRIRCKDTDTGKIYLVAGVAQVKPLPKNSY